MTDPTRDTTDTARPAHTPGPWTTKMLGKFEIAVVETANPTAASIVHVGIENIYRPSAEQHANARLIAEAPTLAAERDYWNERFEAMRAENARLAAVNADLLAILVELYHPTDGPCRAVRPGDWPVHDRARAAIARATGAKC